MSKTARIVVKILLLIIILFLIVLALGKSQTVVNLQEYQDLIEELQKAEFSIEEIDKLLLDARVKFYPDILKKFKKTKVPNYLSSKSRLLKKHFLKEGRDFIKRNQKILQEVEDKYRIEKEILTAILKIESDLGRVNGKYQVFGVYNSIIYYSKDDVVLKRWAVRELVSFLILCKRNRFDPFEIKGSWAGAIGIAQFLPSSCLKYGIDADKDGMVNLFSLKDALHSIAHYLVKHGWFIDKKKALYAYNHSKNYVEGVLAYAFRLNPEKFKAKTR